MLLAQIMASESIENLSDDEILELRKTDEQQLVLRACKIIPTLLLKRVYPAMRKGSDEYDELVQIAALGVLQAVRTWQPDGGRSLQSWAYKLAEQTIIRHRQRESRQTDGLQYSDHTDFWSELETTGDAPVSLPDRAHGEPEGAGERKLQWVTDYDKVYARLTGEEKQLMNLLRLGNSQREISDLLCCGKTTVQRKLLHLYNKIRNMDQF